MAITSADADTQTATGSEDTLTTETTAGVYCLVVDTSNMVSGDEVTLRAYTKNQSGASSVLAYQGDFADAQTEKQKYSQPIPVDTEIIATLEQTAGTMRDYDWNLLKVG